METVAITGGCGVAGQALVRRLMNNDQIKEIRLLDRNCQSSKGSSTPFSLQNPLLVCSDSKIRAFQVELTNEHAVRNALSGCTSVVHLAAPPIPATYQDKEERRKMWADSLEGTFLVPFLD